MNRSGGAGGGRCAGTDVGDITGGALDDMPNEAMWCDMALVAVGAVLETLRGDCPDGNC